VTAAPRAADAVPQAVPEAVKVKICGVTRLEDALLAARLGADAIGLNFWPGSRRCVSAERGAEIARALPAGVRAVGVFVNQPRAEVLRIARAAGLHAVQLHGDETPEDCAGWPLPVWKAVRLAPPLGLAALAGYRVEAFVLDSGGPGPGGSAAWGGTGATCDWTLAREAAARAPAWLAGGLSPANVQEAIRAVRPLGVDVASGVESSPGVKDPVKLEAFVRLAKETT
jgi:phosphoribosylanthranilate isomerase